MRSKSIPGSRNITSRGRTALNWILPSLFLLVAAPTASARFDIGVSGTFRAITRFDLTDPQYIDPAEKLRVEALNKTLIARPELAVAAPKFSLISLGAEPRDSVAALDCMTAAVYYEAGYEPVTGQRAVAQVILNRLRHPAFPNTVCGVVYQGSERNTGCQFTFTCDGSLARHPSSAAWQRARAVAAAALGGYVETSVGHATHYHASYVLPYWAPKLTKLVTIGSHIFYQWAGDWSRPSVFSDRYAFQEAMPLNARKALAGYMLSPDEPDQEAILAQALVASDSLGSKAALASGASRFHGMKEQPADTAALSGSSLNVGKSELIDTKPRLKDASGPVLRTTQGSLAN